MLRRKKPNLSIDLEPAKPKSGEGAFHAGAAKIEITPTPGYSTAGHSIAAMDSRGYWTRLYTRAIYVEDAEGNALALVSCDLWAISAGLADHVAQLIRTKHNITHLDRSRLLIAPTHTHHGPGNFSSSIMYNANAAARSGFDPKIFQFLAQRIAAAIAQAYESRQKATFHMADGPVEGVCRNRSLEAFKLNPEARDILAENENLTIPDEPASPEYTLEAYRAVDPKMITVRLDRADSATPIALLNFIAVHPTSMLNRTEVFTSDIFGLASIMSEQRINADNPNTDCVVAMFNGASGDVSPEWEKQDRVDTMRNGRRLHEKILELSENATEQDTTALASSFNRVTIPGATFPGDNGEQLTVADYAMAGVGTFGGAEDGRTFFHHLGWVEGVTGQRTADHGSKHPAFDLRADLETIPRFLRPFVRPTRNMSKKLGCPRVAPIGVYQLGPLLLTACPGEFTTVMGRRIQAQLKPHAAPTVQHIFPIGLAGEYISYFTTPEEYEAQHYEGASTLYGPNAATFIAHSLTKLTKSLDGKCQTLSKSETTNYETGKQRSFTVDDSWPPTRFPDDGLGHVILDEATRYPVRSGYRVTWNDRIPTLGDPSDPTTRIHPSVAIEQEQHDGAWQPLTISGIEETDQGPFFTTVLNRVNGNSAEWTCFWLRPLSLEANDLTPNTTYRFRIQKLNGEITHSEPFTV